MVSAIFPKTRYRQSFTQSYPPSDVDGCQRLRNASVNRVFLLLMPNPLLYSMNAPQPGAALYTSTHYKRHEDERPWDGRKGQICGTHFPFGVRADLSSKEGNLNECHWQGGKKGSKNVADQKAETAMYSSMVCPPRSACRAYLYEPSRLRG